MLEINETNLKSWSELGIGGTIGKAVIDVAANLPETLVISADLTDATRMREFA